MSILTSLSKDAEELLALNWTELELKVVALTKDLTKEELIKLNQGILTGANLVR